MMKPRIVILASGNGSTAQALIEASADNSLFATVVAVITSRGDAGVIARVASCNQQYGLSIHTHHVGSDNFPMRDGSKAIAGKQTDQEEQEIFRLLAEYQADLVVLLGYMKLVGTSIVARYGYSVAMTSPYQACMVNEHPGLLPATKGYYGIHVQRHVLEENLEAGHCLFAVDVEYDGGPVIAEHQVAREPNDTAEQLFTRVKASEQQHIADDIGQFLAKKKEVSYGG